jgi:hypothetical protein
LFEQRRKRSEEEEAAHSAIPLLSERTGYYCGAVWTEEAKEGAVVVTRMFIENAAELVSYRIVT